MSLARTDNQANPDQGTLQNMAAVIEVRPTINTPENKFSIAQFSMLTLRYTLANVTAIDRNPMFNQPYRELFDYSIINISRESGIGISYVTSSHWLCLIERLRAEGHGNMARGFATMTGKILVVSLAPAAFGAAIGGVLYAFDDTIQQSSVLKIILMPPLWRLTTAITAPLIYAATRRYVLHRFYPPTDFHYNQRPPLHIIQRIMALGFRIYDAVIIFELIHIYYKAYGNPAHLEHPYFPVFITLVDQLFANLIDRIAFRKHTFDGPFPFADEAEEYTESRANVYNASHNRYRCDNGKVVAWHMARASVAISAGVLVNFLLCFAQNNKELLTDSQRMAYNSAICTATVLVERLFEVGLPWLIRKGASFANYCSSRFFSATNNATTEEQADLLAEAEENLGL